MGQPPDHATHCDQTQAVLFSPGEGVQVLTKKDRNAGDETEQEQKKNNGVGDLFKRPRVTDDQKKTQGCVEKLHNGWPCPNPFVVDRKRKREVNKQKGKAP